MISLSTHDLTIDLGGRTVLRSISFTVPAGGITAIVGPNGSGKSTLLRAFASIVQPSAGQVRLDGQDLRNIRPRSRARQIAFLRQNPQAPEGLRVRSLVERGRAPHQGRWGILSKADQEAVDGAMARVGIADLQDRVVTDLSGGQQQRAWIAMALAQDTAGLLLDEPTTFLDPAHQLEILNLLTRLKREDRRTIVMVLHDINLASVFADTIVGVRQGGLVFVTGPDRQLSSDMIQDLFDIDMLQIEHPTENAPLFLSRRESA
ncbi:MAG: ABC transporter ATP-binding protein [Pseudomonadota bacterium]